MKGKIPYHLFGWLHRVHVAEQRERRLNAELRAGYHYGNLTDCHGREHKVDHLGYLWRRGVFDRDGRW